MFQGTLPQSVVKIVGKIVSEWDTKRIYIGCSGNFTIERSISGLVKCPITSNDVTIYSSYIGKYFAGEKLDGLDIRTEFVEKYKIFTDYMETDVDKIATLIIASDMLSYDKPGAYFQRMYNAYIEQFPRMHKQLTEKLKKAKTNIDTFYHGDVMDVLDQVGEHDGFISFPPFYGGGYEKMWSKLEEVFFYERPKYEEFDPNKVLKQFCDKVKKMNNYVICTERPVEELADNLIGQSETMKGKAIYVYGKSTQTHFIEARVKETHAKPIVKINSDYEDFMNTMNDVGKGMVVKNTALTFMCMLRLAQHNIGQLKETWMTEAKPKDVVPLSTIIGRSDIKAKDGLELDKALTLLVDRGVIKKHDKSEGLVKLAEYYLENEKKFKKDKK